MDSSYEGIKNFSGWKYYHNVDLKENVLYTFPKRKVRGEKRCHSDIYPRKMSISRKTHIPCSVNFDGNLSGSFI